MRSIFNTGLFLEPLLDASLDLVRRGLRDHLARQRKISTDALEGKPVSQATIPEPFVPRYVNIFKHGIDDLLRMRYLGGRASWVIMSAVCWCGLARSRFHSPRLARSAKKEPPSVPSQTAKSLPSQALLVARMLVLLG